MRGSAGFTLVELMVVVVLMGVMSAIAVMQANPDAMSADKLTARTALLIQRAKAEAAVRSQPVGCQLNGNGGFCFVRADGTVGASAYVLDADGMVSPGAADVGELVGQLRIHNDLTIDSVPVTGLDYNGSALGAQFFFLPDGIIVDINEAPFSAGLEVRRDAKLQSHILITQAGGIYNVTAH